LISWEGSGRKSGIPLEDWSGKDWGMAGGGTPFGPPHGGSKNLKGTEKGALERGTYKEKGKKRHRVEKSLKKFSNPKEEQI